jgi:hypothetical protein
MPLQSAIHVRNVGTTHRSEWCSVDTWLGNFIGNFRSLEVSIGEARIQSGISLRIDVPELIDDGTACFSKNQRRPLRYFCPSYKPAGLTTLAQLYRCKPHLTNRGVPLESSGLRFSRGRCV